jgi:hypothetical protein
VQIVTLALFIACTTLEAVRFRPEQRAQKPALSNRRLQLSER